MRGKQLRAGKWNPADADMGSQIAIEPWCRRDPRSSPIGISALVLSIVACLAYIAGVARPIANGTLATVLDSGPHNTEILIAVLGSGIAILLSLLSLALEQALLPALLALFAAVWLASRPASVS